MDETPQRGEEKGESGTERRMNNPSLLCAYGRPGGQQAGAKQRGLTCVPNVYGC